MNKVSAKQLETLLDFMDSHKTLATSVVHGALDKKNAEASWNELAGSLNAMGCGCYKSVLRWKRYWIDLKHKVKTRVSDVRRAAPGAGGGPHLVRRLTDVDNRVMALLKPEAICEDTEYKVSAFPASDMGPKVPETIEIVEWPFPFLQPLPAQRIAATPEPAPASSAAIVEDTPLLECEKPARKSVHSYVHRQKILASKRRENDREFCLAKIEEKRVEAELIHARALEKIADNMSVMAQAMTAMAEGMSAIATAVNRSHN